MQHKQRQHEFLLVGGRERLVGLFYCIVKHLAMPFGNLDALTLPSYLFLGPSVLLHKPLLDSTTEELLHSTGESHQRARQTDLAVLK